VTLARRLALVAVCVALPLVAGALPAAAGPQTLKRSIENITLAPLDLGASPIVAGRTLYRNFNDIDDSRMVRIVYPVPGYVWLTSVQAGASVLRFVTGALELLPGLILLPFDAELDPLFDPAEENDALVNVESPVYDLKFGVDYTTAPS
jgi:hypothetical protein